MGLPITVGVARTKFLAKVASGVAKPDGLLVVPPDGELAFLHPLPVERLWGVGPGHRRQAAPTGDLRTVGEVAALTEGALVAHARPGLRPHLHALAHNRDPRPVQPGRPPALDRAPSRPWVARCGRPSRRKRWRPWSTGSPGACEPVAGRAAP